MKTMTPTIISESLSFPCLGWVFMDSFYSAPVCLILYPFVLNGVLSVRASKRAGECFHSNIEGKHEGRSKRPFSHKNQLNAVLVSGVCSESKITALSVRCLMSV